MMKIPTNEEVEIGWNGITADGPGECGMLLGLLVESDPILQEVLSRMTRNAIGLGLVRDNPGSLKAVIAGALMYGLHMGVHIGQSRTQNPKP